MLRVQNYKKYITIEKKKGNYGRILTLISFSFPFLAVYPMKSRDLSYEMIRVSRHCPYYPAHLQREERGVQR